MLDQETPEAVLLPTNYRLAIDAGLRQLFAVYDGTPS